MGRVFRVNLRLLLLSVLVAVCFFGGIQVERERRRREDEVARLAAALETEQKRADEIMARFAPLMDGERYRNAKSLADLVVPRQPLILPPLPAYGGLSPTKALSNWPAEK